MRGRCVAALLVIALASCGREKPALLANASPADATAIAVFNLATLRQAPSYDQLPPAVRALAEPLAGVKQLALVWNGQDLLMLAGDYEQPPSGYTAIGKGIAAAGAPARIEAARQKLAGGAPPPLILPQGAAELVAAIRGNGKLPLPGNLSNAARLLSMATGARATAHVASELEMEVEAQCESATKALQLEESLRAMLTLAAAGTKDAELAQTLRDIRVTRENILIRARVVAKPEMITKAFATR
jgi:hypothetical protein